MNNIDKQIMAAERDLDAFAHGGFTPAWAQLLQTPADHMHALLVERADARVGCPEGSPEEAELATLTDAIEAYETVRWPDGKTERGKGYPRPSAVHHGIATSSECPALSFGCKIAW
jgi:hypothetical protein